MLEGLSKSFENRNRLVIMTMLLNKEKLTFNELKQELGATDGNLANHLYALEKQQLVSSDKKFIEKKSTTSYGVTYKGKLAFKIHLSALQKILQKNVV